MLGHRVGVRARAEDIEVAVTSCGGNLLLLMHVAAELEAGRTLPEEGRHANGSWASRLLLSRFTGVAPTAGALWRQQGEDLAAVEVSEYLSQFFALVRNLVVFLTISQLLLPQPGGYMTDSLDLPPVTKIGLDAAYVLCADDIALARPGAEFAARLGVDPLVIPGNHMTMLTQPAIVADALLAML